jgi:hypothetical protein
MHITAVPNCYNTLNFKPPSHGEICLISWSHCCTYPQYWCVVVKREDYCDVGVLRAADWLLRYKDRYRECCYGDCYCCYYCCYYWWLRVGEGARWLLVGSRGDGSVMSRAPCSNCAGAAVDAQLRSTTTHLITKHRSDISNQIWGRFSSDTRESGSNLPHSSVRQNFRPWQSDNLLLVLSRG